MQFRITFSFGFFGSWLCYSVFFFFIPESNRYTSKMLLAAIDELHKGTYDFFYLPIDFKVLYVTLICTAFIYRYQQLSNLTSCCAYAEQMQCWICVH